MDMFRLLDALDYLFWLLPALALTIWAQGRIMRAYAAGSRIPAAAGVTGAEAAVLVMREGGVAGVAVVPVAGELSDHYDPRGKVLRLSHEVYSGRSLSALGVAAHEAGHAVQDALGYPALVVRNLLVPLAGLGSQLFWLLLTAGFLLGVVRLILWGVILFSVVVALQLVNLPVEFDASRRGRRLLQSAGLMSAQEDQVVSGVLAAAAWTYVAAVLTSLWTLIFSVVRLSVPRRRDRD